MPVIEALFETSDSSLSSDQKWEQRTVESIVDTILERCAEDKRIVGHNYSHVPRLSMLVRDSERNQTFEAALHTVASRILELFPNLPSTDIET